MAHHLRRAFRPMMLTDPNEGDQGNGKDAPSERGGRGNSAINRGALHQGPNDPEVFLSALAFVHQDNFVIQSLKAGNKKFWPSRAIVEGSRCASFKLARRDPSTALGMTDEAELALQRRWHVHQKDHDHNEPDKKFRDHTSQAAQK